MKAEDILRRVSLSLPTDGRLVVGLSGGADSMLLTTWLLQQGYRERLCCVHVNHGIRGAAADRDEAFVRQFCAQQQILLQVFRVDIPALAKAQGIGEEQCGRQVRYQCFEQLAPQPEDRILTAHHADDNAETLLLHLVRGMGPQGAAGIPAVRGKILRPLLHITRAEIEFLCRAWQVPFVTDDSNAEEKYTRNFIRHQVMPPLKQLNPAFPEAVSRFTDSMTLVNDYMAQQAQILLQQAAHRDGLSLKKLREAHPALLACALEQYLALPVLSAELLCRVQRCVLQGGGMDLPGGLRLTAKQDVLTVTPLEKPNAAVFLPLQEGDNTLPDGTVVQIREIPEKNEKNSRKVHNLLFNNTFGCDRITEDFTLRTRQPGDRFRPAGRGVSKTLKKLLNERRIPAALRDTLLLIEHNGEIVWIESVGAAEGWQPGSKLRNYSVRIEKGN